MTDIEYTDPAHNPRRLERLAAQYDADTAAEYDRIRRDIPADKISPRVRMAAGYSDSARDAAEALPATGEEG